MDDSELRKHQQKDIAEHYDERYADSNDTLFALDTRFIERYVPPGGRLIDFGCGTGRHLAHFAAKGHNVTGLDLSKEMLRVCKFKLDSLGLKATLAHGDMAELFLYASSGINMGEPRPPLEGNTHYRAYDVAICAFNSIELVNPRQRDQAIRNARMALKPGGHYIVQTHNRSRWTLTARGRAKLWQNAGAGPYRYLGTTGSGGHKGEPSSMLYIPSEDELRHCLIRAGFEIVEFRYIRPERDGYFLPPEQEAVPNDLCEVTSLDDAGLRAYGFIVAARKPKGDHRCRIS